MEYIPEEWVDHLVDENGNVLQQGTPFTAAKMNNIENGIAGAYEKIETANKNMETQKTEMNKKLSTMQSSVNSAVAAVTGKFCVYTVTSTSSANSMEVSYPSGYTYNNSIIVGYSMKEPLNTYKECGFPNGETGMGVVIKMDTDKITIAKSGYWEKGTVWTLILMKIT